MIGFILAALAVGAVCSAAEESSRRKSYTKDLEYENYRLRQENNYIKLTIYNLSSLLKNYDKVNRYAKDIGFRGAVDFFYYLGDEHDSRFLHFARFLNKVRHIRNDIAHNGTIYNIDNGFLEKLDACWTICEIYECLPRGHRFYLG